MKFFLGTHRPGWLGRPEFTDIPLFVSHVTLKGRVKMPYAVCDWALDSGGFTQLSRDPNGWPPGCEEPYVDAVRHYMSAGRLIFASQQDWMCEPWLLQDRSVLEHQERTVANYLRLLELAPDVPWLPVLQGWELDDYLRHVEMFAAAGVLLQHFPHVGIGSVCRRQATDEIGAIVTTIASLGIRAHGFGVKTLGLRKYAASLTTADSMAWSFRARKREPLEGCSHGPHGTGNCANCPRFALAWREAVLTGESTP